MKFRDGIARDPRGKWHLRIIQGGKVVKGTFESKPDAEHARAQLRQAAEAARLGLPGPEKPAKRLTVGVVLEAYLQECKALDRSPTHIRSLQQSRDLLLKWSGEARSADLTRADLVAFVAWSRAHTASQGRAIHRAISILRTALRRADLPVPSAPALRLPARRQKTMSLDELRRLLAELPLGTATRTAVEVGLATGARESEIRRIRSTDVDLVAGLIWLRRQKGRQASQEPCPITIRCREALAAHQPGPEFLFSSGSAPPSLWCFRRFLEAACRRADVPTRTTVGWTRAQVATLARDAGARIGTVSSALGHEETRVTIDHYDESRRAEAERFESRRQVADQVSKILGEQPESQPN